MRARIVVRVEIMHVGAEGPLVVGLAALGEAMVAVDSQWATPRPHDGGGAISPPAGTVRR